MMYTVDEIGEDEWDQAMTVNVKGYGFPPSRYFLIETGRQGQGKLRCRERIRFD
jgi:hypothetical protein